MAAGRRSSVRGRKTASQSVGGWTNTTSASPVKTRNAVTADWAAGVAAARITSTSGWVRDGSFAPNSRRTIVP